MTEQDKNKRAQAADEKYIEFLKAQPQVDVVGNAALVPFCGTVYTTLYNLRPVSLPLDGRPHKFPKPVAEYLEGKLREIATANIPISSNEKLS